MVQTLAADKLMLYDLEQRFKLQQVDDQSFFGEWQGTLPELTEGAEFSSKVGIPQVLSYMLAAPNGDRPRYGLVTNGTDFVFLKLFNQDIPQYARSQQFLLGQARDLDRVLQILKRLAEIVGQEN
jgi:hypothetical protein